EESRRSPAWIAAQGILDGDHFAQAVDSLTMRSMQWRGRGEGGGVGGGGLGGGGVSEPAVGDGGVRGGGGGWWVEGAVGAVPRGADLRTGRGTTGKKGAGP